MSDGQPISLWISQMHDGDERAVQKLWEHYYPQLVVHARGQLAPGSRRDADEDDDDHRKRQGRAKRGGGRVRGESAFLGGDAADTTGGERRLRPHAEGGMGMVSEARDEELDRRVALKEIRPHLADSWGTSSMFATRSNTPTAAESCTAT